MEPLTMALIASAVSAGLPYAAQVGKTAWDAAWDVDAPDMSGEMERKRQQEEEQDEVFRNLIAQRERSYGRATGAALGAGGGAGILGFNPVLMAQARQGELHAAEDVGNIQRDWLGARQASEASRMQAVQETGRGIMAASSTGVGRRKRFRAMAEGYGAGTPEYDRLMAMSSMA